MHRVLQRMGHCYLRGVQQNYLAESLANVAYRAQYLAAKLKNRDADNNPIVPEVYLDESYCNQRHVSARSWLDSTRSHLKDTDNGYHGNFNAARFEDWFRKLCTTLSNTHGSCVIHLDGAKYHKRLLNPQPTTAWPKSKIQEWLGSIFTLIFICNLVIAKAHCEPAHYACVAIAF
ncbi:hypothetical protein ACHHYP_13223 [Achlya hypogyna]|uniref:Tc1-like transposase DDE domain-containing protein n=1 Tax=Achlya hypogyna TaxID=1202772 RepID=A0A1V9ZFT8_ACHHY|nr:hypothetical protein ACHHYP_13223 [Achlya hypogyna]